MLSEDQFRPVREDIVARYQQLASIRRDLSSTERMKMVMEEHEAKIRDAELAGADAEQVRDSVRAGILADQL